MTSLSSSSPSSSCGCRVVGAPLLVWAGSDRRGDAQG